LIEGACLARIAAREADVRAWSYVDPDAVIRQTRELDKLPSRGPLHGIPVGVKDIYSTADMPTSTTRRFIPAIGQISMPRRSVHCTRRVS
jgi:Asp-tRNA(Asn)/Glu-tRNA(Gln) amidotransferase A subunit family amidase